VDIDFKNLTKNSLLLLLLLLFYWSTLYMFIIQYIKEIFSWTAIQ